MRAILLPVFMQIMLTFGLAIALALSRISALRTRQIAMKDIALGQQDAWPDTPRKIGRSYQSQFEIPVLFYVLAGLAITTDKVDAALTAGAWLFVATRLAHAYIHVTSNRVPRRFQAFAAGVTILILMWIEFALRILFA